MTSTLEARADDLTGEPQTNLRVLQEQLEAIAAGDLDTVLSRAHQDVTLEIFAPPEFPFVRHARGADAFREALRKNFDAVINQRPQVRDVFADGNRVVLFGRETGAIRATGLTYDVEFVERFTFHRDRLATVQIIVAHSKPLGD